MLLVRETQAPWDELFPEADDDELDAAGRVKPADGVEADATQAARLAALVRQPPRFARR